VTEWLAFSRACVADLDGVLAELPTRVEREPVLRTGEGGDDTTAIDAAAEDAVVRRLAAAEAAVTVFPHVWDADEIAGYDGVMPSNGPRDPRTRTLAEKSGSSVPARVTISAISPSTSATVSPGMVRRSAWSTQCAG